MVVVIAQSGSSPGEGPTCVTGNLSRSSRGPGITQFLTSCATVLDNPGCGRVGKGVDPARPRGSTDLDGGSMASRPLSAPGARYSRVMVPAMYTPRNVSWQARLWPPNTALPFYRTNGQLHGPLGAKFWKSGLPRHILGIKPVLTKEPYLSLLFHRC